jgi:hypothetical protein
MLFTTSTVPCAVLLYLKLRFVSEKEANSEKALTSKYVPKKNKLIANSKMKNEKMHYQSQHTHQENCNPTP